MKLSRYFIPTMREDPSDAEIVSHKLMVRAGMKEEVLKSNSWQSCVSCYNCVVRCPRSVPVKYILQGLGALAIKEGYVEATESDNSAFGKAFWTTASKSGRTDERAVTIRYFYQSGGIAGLIKKGMANLSIAIALVKTRRMSIFALPDKVRGTADLKAIMAKAQEIQLRHSGAGDQ